MKITENEIFPFPKLTFIKWEKVWNLKFRSNKTINRGYKTERNIFYIFKNSQALGTSTMNNCKFWSKKSNNNIKFGWQIRIIK